MYGKLFPFWGSYNTTTEKTLVKEVVRLFQDSIWKLYGLPESIIINRRA